MFHFFTSTMNFYEIVNTDLSVAIASNSRMFFFSTNIILNVKNYMFCSPQLWGLLLKCYSITLTYILSFFFSLMVIFKIGPTHL